MSNGNVVNLRPDRVEVFFGREIPSNRPRWYVERIEAGFDDGFIVHDVETEAEAIAEAHEWGVPVVIRRQA